MQKIDPAARALLCRLQVSVARRILVECYETNRASMPPGVQSTMEVAIESVLQTEEEMTACPHCIERLTGHDPECPTLKT